MKTIQSKIRPLWMWSDVCSVLSGSLTLFLARRWLMQYKIRLKQLVLKLWQTQLYLAHCSFNRTSSIQLHFRLIRQWRRPAMCIRAVPQITASAVLTHPSSNQGCHASPPPWQTGLFYAGRFQPWRNRILHVGPFGWDGSAPRSAMCSQRSTLD